MIDIHKAILNLNILLQSARLGKPLIHIKYSTSTVPNLIASLKARNWIDFQTKSVMSKRIEYLNLDSKVFIGKNIGSYLIVDIVLEVVVDHVTRSITSFVVTPMLATNSEIIFSIITFTATIAMIIISVLDLNNIEVNVLFFYEF